MGHYAGKCMLAYANNEQDSLMMDFCFELFAHTTKFFNMKVVLLGNYHESDMKKYENLIRVTPGKRKQIYASKLLISFSHFFFI